jgi:hypothetical protein
MPENEKPDPVKKPMDDWFVGNEDVIPAQKPVTPPPLPSGPAPVPNGKLPGKSPLVTVLLALTLIGAGGYYLYTLRSSPAKMEEITIEMPKLPQETAPVPVAPVPVEPVVTPTPKKKPSVAPPDKPPAKRPAAKKAAEPVQPPAPKEEPSPPPKVEAPPIPSSGIMLWSGKVEKNGTIVIDNGKSETGAVNGAALPGVPVSVSVEPKGFTITEPPSAATGWKRMTIHSQKKAHIVVTVKWNRL